MFIFFFSYSDASKKKASWAYRVFFDWKVARNLRTITDKSLKFLRGDLIEMSTAELVESLTRFIFEARDKNGDYYKSDTLYELVMALQMYMHIYGRYVKFLDDPAFVEVRNALNNMMKFLASKGYKCPREKADAIDVEDENEMWSKGILGDSNPEQLVQTLLYQLGIGSTFCS